MQEDQKKKEEETVYNCAAWCRAFKMSELFDFVYLKTQSY